MARLWMVSAVALVVAACGRTSHQGQGQAGGGAPAVGGAGTSGAAAAGTSSGGTAGLAAQCPGAPIEPVAEPLALLAGHELENELSRFEQPLAGAVLPEHHSRILEEYTPSATFEFVQSQAALARDIAQKVSSDAALFKRVVGCDLAAQGAEACLPSLTTFVSTRLFRELASDETEQELRDVYAEGAKLGGDEASGLRAVLQVALQSPEFLYHLEIGESDPDRPPGWNRLSSLELASRLAFLLWDRSPDDELLAAAEGGQLSEPSGVEAQARRLLEDPQARVPVRRFYRELLQVPLVHTFVNETFPDFTPRIYDLMSNELDAFVDDATFQGAGDFSALFRPITWVNAPLAEFYGFPAVMGEKFQRVDLDGSRYAGLLTLGAWLTRGAQRITDPSWRGYVLSRAFFYQDLPPPHPFSPPENQLPSATMTTRQRYEVQTGTGACAPCHVLMDPLGFGLEHFDASGRWRDMEAGLPIDAAASFSLPPPDGSTSPGSSQITFEGTAELAAVIRDLPSAKESFVRDWQRFAFGLSRGDGDPCEHEALVKRFGDAHENVLELLVALTQTDSFRYRRNTRP